MADNLRAFTLIEILIVIALLSAIAGLGLFASADSYRRTTAREERAVIVALLARAESRAMNGIDGLSHGFCYDEKGGAYLIFEGKYRDGAVESAMPKGRGITVDAPRCGTGAELIFTPLSGTTTPETITLADGTESSAISVNEAGTIDW